MLEITVETKDGVPNKLEWSGSAKEFERLWNYCEESRNPRGKAGAVIQSMITGQPPARDAVAARGQAIWVVYAVLRYAADSLDMSSMAPGVLPEPTIFELAEAELSRRQSAPTRTKRSQWN